VECLRQHKVSLANRERHLVAAIATSEQNIKTFTRDIDTSTETLNIICSH